MTILSAALEARDKATKGPWYLDIRVACLAIYPESKKNDTQGCHPEDERNIHFSEKDAQYLYPQWSMSKQAQIDAIVMVAAPDALDWIARALPWIVEKAGETKELLKRIRTEEDAGEWNKEIPGLEEDLETLTALIAQAEGKKGGEERPNLKL